MKFFTFIFFALSLAIQACAEPVAVFTPDESKGIELVQHADGQTDIWTHTGRKAVVIKRNTTPPSNFMYFRLSPEAREKVKNEFWLVVDFQDVGVSKVELDYNSDKGPYTKMHAFDLVGSATWYTTVIHVKDANLSGSQNSGADFRFATTGHLVLSKLEVHDSEPKVDAATTQMRIKNFLKTLPKQPNPKNMYYTFGNDADDASAQIYKALGATSIESYVTWETCEGKGKDNWDWSRWDNQVKVLKKNGLKWVPFLIAGPAYANPNWFRQTKDHFPCRCLEHGIDSKIESLWNPNMPKWIDRFLAAFAKRYGKSGVIESVLIGIHGDFGEALYSITGGGWTFDIPGPYHNHPGYWCNDPYALADFRKFIKARYNNVKAVNNAWGTSYASLDEVDYPGYKEEFENFLKKIPEGNPQVRRRWLDFIDWYRAAMTRFADWWLATTRKYFPNTPIYLCAGGDGSPSDGANFAEQCRVAAKHKAGVRITNESSFYPTNVSLTRWVASAGKHYGAYYGFEPAGAIDEIGIMVRIYNATASGANQLHDYPGNITNSEETIKAQRKNIKYLYRTKPIVPVALWYPDVHLMLSWGEFLSKSNKVRDYTDFDFVDESMLRTGALKRYDVLLIIHGTVMETKDAKLIAKWIESGGRVFVVDVPKFESVEKTLEPETILFGNSPEGRKYGKGGIRRVANLDEMANHLQRVLAEKGYPKYPIAEDGIYFTQVSPNKALLLNLRKDNQITISYKGKTKTVDIAGLTIKEVEF